MSIFDYASIFLTALGTVFFIASTLGILRFPDVYSRLHALTKADNVGLGLIVIGIALHDPKISTHLKLIVIWLSVVVSGSASCYLVARTALRMKILPWKRS
ncbi:MAG: monovalent cation/H(+) antiporter subunit G [Chlamydiales bacterium]